METCRHFRYRIPREEADELRDADPEPCPVCDALPHRQRRIETASIPLDVLPVVERVPAQNLWLTNFARWMRLAAHKLQRAA